MRRDQRGESSRGEGEVGRERVEWEESGGEEELMRMLQRKEEKRQEKEGVVLCVSV